MIFNLIDLTQCFSQPWENTCKCGDPDGDVKDGIVQIYQLEENAPYQNDKKLPIKLKIPLGLGALISPQHVLTTKLCFGEYKTHVAPMMPYEQKIFASSVTVLVGTDVSYRYPNVEGTGIEAPLKVSEKDEFVDVITIKLSPDSHFCILTLKQYIQFGLHPLGIRMTPLCLPEINNQHDEEFQGTILGFGYNENFPGYVKGIAKEGKMKERPMKKLSFQIMSSSKCKDEFGHWYLARKSGQMGVEHFWMEK